jgi:chemotaxis protein CheD
MAAMTLPGAQALPSAAGRRVAVYLDPRLGGPTVQLLAGDALVTDEDVGIATVLGSCVALCLFDPALGLGGMNHYLLPGEAGAAPSLDHGVTANAVLLRELLARGAARERLQAKVFGGASVLPSCEHPVGALNAAHALEFLAAERIAVAARDLGGHAGRQVVFLPRTGEARVRRFEVRPEMPGPGARQ